MNKSGATMGTPRVKARLPRALSTPARAVRRAFLLAGTTLLLGGCSGNPYYDPTKPHHTPDGFRNNDLSIEHRSPWRFLWERLTTDIPDDPEGGYGLPVLKPDVAFLRDNRVAPTLTWIGHATLLLQVGGVNILTDPHLTERASPVDWVGPKRRVPPALDFDGLPHIDVVLVSHNHYDHQNLETLQRLHAQPGGPPRYYVALGNKPWFTANGISNVVEQDWWESERYLGLEIHQVPAQHFSARSLFDRDEVLWGGFVVLHPALRFYFAGDTGYGPHFEEIGRRLGPIDLAALPVGAYEPRWFMKPVHVNPAEAVQAHQDLGARYAVGMHWGTFRLTYELLDEPPRALARARTEQGVSEQAFFLMQHGETRMLAPQIARGATGDAAGSVGATAN